LAPLRAGGWIEPWSGECVDLDVDGALGHPSRDPLLRGQLWRGCGGMERITHGLLELAERSAPVERHWGHRVRRLELRPGGGWRLFNGDGEDLAEVDWLVLSGSLLAHPRSTELLGWPEVPLRQVAATSRDGRLQTAVTAIGKIRWEGRLNLLTVIPADQAEPWRDLPFRLGACRPEAQERWGLSRLSIQPLVDGRCVVVVHSTDALASRHRLVFGSSSSVAQELDQRPSPEAETRLMLKLGESLIQALAPWIPPELGARSLEGADTKLMRWGAAFARNPGLDPALAICPDSRIGFCGDYLAGSGFGRVEGALRSAEVLGERLLAINAKTPAP
jgi:predicted NAD/FAD-dependent oxidoreductase